MNFVHRLILFSFLLPLFLGCGRQSDTPSQTDMDITLSMLSETQKVSFAPAQFNIQRIVLEITGLGLDKISMDIPVTNETIEVTEGVVVASGDRRFEAFAYDAEGLAYSGFVETTLSGGRRVVDITMVPVPRVTRLSLQQAVPGDMIKISGRVFGTPPEGERVPANSRVTVNGVEAEVVRWNDVAIIVIVPDLAASNTPVPVLVEFGEQKSDDAFTVQIQDQVVGVGGKDKEGNLDSLTLPILPVAGMSVIDKIGNVAAGPTASVAISGNASTVAEATVTDANDVAISRDGGVILTASKSGTLKRRMVGSTDKTIGNGDCIREVALSSDGHTAAAVGAPCSGGASRLYRIDDVTGNATFTRVSEASSETYTDVAMSEDASTVVVGWLKSAATGGIHRILNFATTPVLRTDTLPSELERVQHVDVDLSADGITAIVGMQDSALPESVIFQIWDADLPTDRPFRVVDKITLSAVVGVAINSGGSLAIVKIFDDDPGRGAAIHRFDQFNVAPAELPAPLKDPLLNAAKDDNPVSDRSQDQIDLQ